MRFVGLKNDKKVKSSAGKPKKGKSATGKSEGGDTVDEK